MSSLSVLPLNNLAVTLQVSSVVKERHAEGAMVVAISGAQTAL